MQNVETYSGQFHPAHRNFSIFSFFKKVNEKSCSLLKNAAIWPQALLSSALLSKRCFEMFVQMSVFSFSLCVDVLLSL